MVNNKKVVVVLPAYNASKTLEITYREIDFTIVDDVILVDDLSKDDTVEVGKKLGIKHIVVHEQNKGYGGNQKSCYNKALEIGADIVIIHSQTYSGHDSPVGQWFVSCGFRLAHFGKRCFKGRNANNKMDRQPWTYPLSEHFDECKTLGISFGLPRIYTRSIAKSKLQCQFR